jgi:2-dehydro-3-deoxyphosphogluconate aldolase / (4S)-4-hydroxy-2-oxoglutarate aldolase
MEMNIKKENTLLRIRKLGLLAVIRGPSLELTIKMVEALIEGGVLGIEVTFSTPNAIEVVKILSQKYSDHILLGMGTLTNPEQVLQAKKAGASFLVSPHCDSELAKKMIESDLAVMIGALSPTEVVQAYEMGSVIVKLFPGSLGGPAYLKALRGPFPHIPMMPTGGVDVENVEAWFAAGAIAVGAGSNLCSSALAKEGRFNEIKDKAVEFHRAIRKAQKKLNLLLD